MSDLLRSYLKPLASDYLNATTPKLKDEAAFKVANIIFILTYGEWESRKLTKLLSQFDYMTADEMCIKIKNAIGPEDFIHLKKGITHNSLKARSYADRCRRDTQSIVLKWTSIYASIIGIPEDEFTSHFNSH